MYEKRFIEYIIYIKYLLSVLKTSKIKGVRGKKSVFGIFFVALFMNIPPGSKYVHACACMCASVWMKVYISTYILKCFLEHNLKRLDHAGNLIEILKLSYKHLILFFCCFIPILSIKLNSSN